AADVRAVDDDAKRARGDGGAVSADRLRRQLVLAVGHAVEGEGRAPRRRSRDHLAGAPRASQRDDGESVAALRRHRRFHEAADGVPALAAILYVRAVDLTARRD